MTLSSRNLTHCPDRKSGNQGKQSYWANIIVDIDPNYLYRTMDLEMMTMFNARERPLADWVKLCSDADNRLKLRSISRPEGSVLSVMEFILDDQ